MYFNLQVLAIRCVSFRLVSYPFKFVLFIRIFRELAVRCAYQASFRCINIFFPGAWQFYYLRQRHLVLPRLWDRFSAFYYCALFFFIFFVCLFIYYLFIYYLLLFIYYLFIYYLFIIYYYLFFYLFIVLFLYSFTCLYLSFINKSLFLFLFLLYI